MKNWKTTAGGIFGGIAAIAGGLKLLFDGVPQAGEMEMAMSAFATGIGMIVVGWHALDKQKPTETDEAKKED